MGRVVPADADDLSGPLNQGPIRQGALVEPGLRGRTLRGLTCPLEKPRLEQRTDTVRQARFDRPEIVEAVVEAGREGGAGGAGDGGEAHAEFLLWAGFQPWRRMKPVMETVSQIPADLKGSAAWKRSRLAQSGASRTKRLPIMVAASSAASGPDMTN